MDQHENRRGVVAGHGGELLTAAGLDAPARWVIVGPPPRPTAKKTQTLQRGSWTLTYATDKGSARYRGGAPIDLWRYPDQDADDTRYDARLLSFVGDASDHNLRIGTLVF